MLLSNRQRALRPRSERKHAPFSISLKPVVGDADHFREGACGSVNRPAESLTQPATYPARGIWSAISNGQSARLITGDILVRLQGGPPKNRFLLMRLVMAARLTDKQKKKIVADYLELGSYNAVAKKKSCVWGNCSACRGGI